MYSSSSPNFLPHSIRDSMLFFPHLRSWYIVTLLSRLYGQSAQPTAAVGRSSMICWSNRIYFNSEPVQGNRYKLIVSRCALMECKSRKHLREGLGCELLAGHRLGQGWGWDVPQPSIRPLKGQGNAGQFRVSG